MNSSTRSDIDVLVIGGSAAGSAAALQLGRVRRSVVVVDAGEPRNAPAAHMQGYLGHDGMAPADFVARAHDEVRAYGTEIVVDRIIEVTDDEDRLVGTTESGRTFRARRILLATGLRDLLPDIPGVWENWGDRVIHCPWCHGWEVRDQRIAVIDTTGMGTHQALIFAQLSARVTLVVNTEATLTDEQRERLELAGVAVEDRSVIAIDAQDDHLTLNLGGAAVDDSASGRLDVDVAAVAPRFEPNATVVEHLVDVADHMSDLGRVVAADALTGLTSHPRIHAAGNVADPMQQVLHAAAHGSRVATMLNVSLIEEDLDDARRSAEERTEWNDRYAGRGDQMWSGNPNGSLVAEVSGVAPGRALDVGCGEGADAIWLAQQGWEVTATDISTTAIARARAAASARAVDVSFEAVDAAVDPPPAASFDLVTIAYPSFKRDNGARTFRSILDSVARGGALFVIGHVLDEEALKHAHEHGFDPAIYLLLDDMVDLLPRDFSIEVDDTRERPNAPADSHHSQDRVLVLRRDS
ncbi:bifunctional NAD(P)/FAD-dependent oxidoreductase/class I SAM-dependent methyltransferase [Ilumatobacter nonamiensis]|uniref:bifunctional NAD(P)/FAD-dependent oxidoreductase/class I SAM-dependent methyltransferase n=1 Tax=Ilumatobacter nonamiensis TaxID=467093 RepID=UPI0003499660|nr:bifunctional NAD(P)/FAD-dependent oxidoreductase/class I SAM-dependent methyltransferase [Ilumatobacter nonamiensis]